MGAGDEGRAVGDLLVAEAHTISFAISRQTWGNYSGKDGGKVECGKVLL